MSWRARWASSPSFWRDIPAFVASILRSQAAVSVGKQALEFTLLTAAPSGEVRGMKWDEIDVEKKIWTVPASRMKAKVSHRVPLTPRATASQNSCPDHLQSPTPNRYLLTRNPVSSTKR